MLDMCKLTIALGFAAIAGLTAIAAGLMNEVRISVILMRTICIFLLTGVGVYIGVFLFEKFSYKKLIEDTESAMLELKAQEQEQMSQTQDTEEEGRPEAGDEQKQEEQSEGGFAPLQPDSLRRVTGSTENQ